MKKCFLIILLCSLINIINGQEKKQESKPNKFANYDADSTEKRNQSKSEVNTQPDKSELTELSGEAIAASLDSVSVRIQGNVGLDGISYGSGVIISNEGYVLTNYHVVAEMTNLIADNKIVPKTLLEVVYLNKDRDIAICKLKGSVYNAVKRGSSNEIHTGSTIYSMGCPLGYLNYFTRGIISAKQILDNKFFLIHDASIASGNSGGALVNVKGELIGINVMATIQQKDLVIQNLNLAIPINDMYGILKRAGYVYVFGPEWTPVSNPKE